MERTILDVEGDPITVASVATDPGQITISAEEGGSGCYFMLSERKAVNLALAIMEAVEEGTDPPSFARQELRDLAEQLDYESENRSRGLTDEEFELFEGIDTMLTDLIRQVAARELFGLTYTELSTPVKALVDMEIARKG